ncbi:hypothetical protein [Natrinema sp. 1APR25-10V2]|uniref:hypothetical protein n=1 Tax=Natrinema sp. 1APR25-10V2 TaxID=2951081 RepID=UPI00287532F8|nr:hypothetical protein [Natrinema sp. 1APR25-10V2]MDS0473920.1 hypothetical protein [Natrinema sp. 1APR25-10V2]
MDLRNPLKWAILYRIVAVGALVLGLALVAAGLVVGFGGAITALFTDPLDPGPAIEQANPVITLLFAALGVVVWQLGKTYALFVTLPRAAGRAAGRQVDANRVASEVRDSLEDRLTDLETEIEETRRAVEALEDGDRQLTYDEREHGADEPSASVSNTSSDREPLAPSSPKRSGNDGDAGSVDDGNHPDAGSDGDDPLA